MSPAPFNVIFWGVCGSIPAPLTGQMVENKLLSALRIAHASGESLPTNDEDLRAWMRRVLPFPTRFTHGGNTTCVEVSCGEELLILDMGTGLRGLGMKQQRELFRTRKLRGTILQSHMHWDHIQGVPFWGPLYVPRDIYACDFTFFGGKAWDAQLEIVLAGQMNPPVFPVNIQELRQTAMRMEFQTVWDGRKIEIPSACGPIRVLAKKLFHPQETFGYRIEFAGRVLVFTTDHEPYADGIPNGLLALVAGADLWITDCQYTHETYLGQDGVQKFGWGHSYPEYIARVAKEAKPKSVLTTHHDPGSSDELILHIAARVAELSGIPTTAAYEGLTVSLA